MKLTTPSILVGVLLQLPVAAMAPCDAPSWGVTIAQAQEVPDYTFQLEGSDLVLLPPAGHHFNTDAPTQIKAGTRELQPRVTEKKITVGLSRFDLRGPIQTTAYLCDDAKTYCIKKKQSFNPSGGPSEAAGGEVGKPASAQKTVSKALDKNGFILNDPDRAFALAREKGLPVLIDFFGIWCPPCNSIDAVVFGDPKFKKSAQTKVIRLKMDADREEAQALKAKYKIKALPTLLFATSGGEEIFRILGFRPLPEMMRRLDLAYQNRGVGYDTLAARAKGGKDLDAALKAAQIATDQDDTVTAIALLAPYRASLAAPGDARREILYQADLAAAASKEDVEAQRQTLRAWLAEFPKSMQGLDLYQQLAELEEGRKNATASGEALRQALALADSFLKVPPVELASKTDYTQGDLQALRADIYEQLGESGNAKDAFQACVKAYESEAKAEKSAFPRGPSLNRAYCLAKLGKLDESERIYREGVRRYPKEFTFHNKLARLLHKDRKNPEAALLEIDAALQYAYGNQRPAVVLSKAQILEDIGGKKSLEQAKVMLDAEIAAPLPEGASSGAKKTREKLEKLRQGIVAKLAAK